MSGARLPRGNSGALRGSRLCLYGAKSADGNQEFAAPLEEWITVMSGGCWPRVQQAVTCATTAGSRAGVSVAGLIICPERVFSNIRTYIKSAICNDTAPGLDSAGEPHTICFSAQFDVLFTPTTQPAAPAINTKRQKMV